MEVSIRKLRLREDGKLISPPIAAEPLYGGATAVTVLSFLAGPHVSVQVNGATVVNQVAGLPDPAGQTFPPADSLNCLQGVQ